MQSNGKWLFLGGICSFLVISLLFFTPLYDYIYDMTQMNSVLRQFLSYFFLGLVMGGIFLIIFGIGEGFNWDNRTAFGIIGALLLPVSIILLYNTIPDLLNYYSISTWRSMLMLFIMEIGILNVAIAFLIVVYRKSRDQTKDSFRQNQYYQSYHSNY